MMDDLPSSLVDDLRDGLTYDDFDSQYDMSSKQARRVVDELRDSGVEVQERTVNRHGKKMYILDEDNVDDEYSWIREDGEYSFAVISDTHLGSEAEQLDSLNEFYDRVADEDISIVFHAGDISDGADVYRGHSQHKVPEAIGWGRLEDYVVENYPERDGVVTAFIEGNHDRKLFKDTGVRFGKQIAERRDDLMLIGDCFADVTLDDENDVNMHLVHPSGGVPYCYSPDTKILTERFGFVEYRDVPDLVERVGGVDNLRVATFDMDTGEMEFESPESLYITPHDGEMVNIVGQGVDQLVTKNHRVVVRDNGDHHARQGGWTVLQAEDIKEGFVRQKWDVPRSADWTGENPDSFVLEADHHNGNRFESDISDFAELLGWYVSEGHLKERSVVITQMGEERDEVTSVLESIGITYSLQEQTGKIKFSNIELVKWLEDHAGRGSKNKKVPEVIRSASKPVIETFLLSLFKGDGTISDGEFVSYTTSSERLMADVVELLMKTGRAASVRERDRPFEINGFTGESSVFELTVSEKNPDPSLCVEPEIVRSSEPAYCFEVSNGTLVTMRNGKVSVSGNTPGYRAMTWLRDRNDEDKADITVFGHLHKFINAHVEGSEVLYGGAWQGETPYLQRKGIKPENGGWIVDMEIGDGGGIESWQTDRVQYPLENPDGDVTMGDIDDFLDGR